MVTFFLQLPFFWVGLLAMQQAGAWQVVVVRMAAGQGES